MENLPHGDQRLCHCNLGCPNPGRNSDVSIRQIVDFSSNPDTIFVVYASPANPNYNAEELQHQLSVSGAKFIVIHSGCLSAAKKASNACGLSDNSLLLIDKVVVPGSLPLIPTLEDAITFGWSNGENYKAVRFRPGEARKTIAFLSFSSGTTGN